MTTTDSRVARSARVATVVAATLARVALGALWLHEGIVKYHAGFGRADILLVVQSAASNERVPGSYRAFTRDVVGHIPAAFGVGVPLLEVALGIALILGIATLPVALLSAFQLCNYWSADQLVTQYPVMLVLSVVVATFATGLSQINLLAVVVAFRHTGTAAPQRLSASGREGRSILSIGHHQRGVI